MKDKLQGQILVIVVMVLMLLGIIILGVVAIVTRDVEQSVGSQQYEQSYNLSEEKMLLLLDDYSDVSNDLSTLVNQGCSGFVTTGIGYTCTYTTDEYFTSVNVSDTDVVEDFELGKDETFKVILDGYTGEVDIRWTGEVALELSLEYKVGDEYKVVKGVSDKYSILSQNAAVADQAVSFTESGTIDEITVDVADTIASAGGGDSLYLKIKPLMKYGISTQIAIDGEAGFPNQVRKFESVSYVNADNVSSSAPMLVTQIPLAGYEPEILNYVLRSENVIQK